MLKNKLLCLAVMLLAAHMANAQVVKLESILDSIRAVHPVIKMYDYEIRSMDAAAKGARSWMPPEFSSGLWMVPYDPSRWKKMDDGMGGTTEGMGQYMIGGQQMFPSRKKLDADAKYMETMSSVEKEKKNATLNELVNDAKQLYYEWLVLKKRQSILEQNEKLLDFMIKNAEIRYRNGLEKINAYYKAKAALGNIQNMRLMADNDIREKRIRINALMNRNVMTDFEIDTAYILTDYSSMAFDSTLFYGNRSDLKAVDNQINLTYLKQETEKQSLRPQFGVRYEHMFGFGGLPMQYSVMGMLKLPMARWSSKMNRANMESLRLKATALQSQKEMMLNEYSGMAYGMRNELELKRKQLQLYDSSIVPALQNNYKIMQLGYEQNTEELFMLFDAWETLYMARIEQLELLGQALKLQVSIERLIEQK
ncbi:TolC family protein [Flavihumibacter solisilvae]|uniref:Transporter n=1 Tax=Flavihumibacter solisilvae TaxID=1349421 RepID=A0A0C1IHK7_9BACT|nr:TolC family protein [Flavihumibacter solisilvae]KIC93690.1 transporter [Flavihumibacter solisilvae]